MSDTKRAVIYARQSITRGEPDQSLSIEMQVRECSEYIVRQGWVHAGTFTDPDTKGWKASRPGFDAMLDRVRAGDVHQVVVYKLSRFSRDLVMQETVLREINDAGATLASVTEPYLSTPMIRQILGAVNEEHRRTLHDFAVASYAARARRGLHHSAPPYGYRSGQDGKLVIEESEAEVIREMFAMAFGGAGLAKICYALNRKKIPSPKGTVWNHATIRRLMANPVYAGHIRFKGEIVVRNAHEAIVNPDEWERWRKSGKRSVRIHSHTATSWTNGYVYHTCGERMYLTSWPKVPEGMPPYRYKCRQMSQVGTVTATRCSHHGGSVYLHIVEREFVRKLIAAISTLVTPDEVMSRIEARSIMSEKERARHLAKLERRRTDIIAKRNRLLDLALAGRIDDEVFSERDGQFRDALQDIDAEIRETPDVQTMDQIVELHGQISSVTSAVLAVARSAPEELPPLLHDLDLRFVWSGSTGTIEFGEMTRDFFVSE